MNTYDKEEMTAFRELISSYPDAYKQGTKSFQEGEKIDIVPFAQGSKISRDKRIAWYTGWLDARSKERFSHYDKIREEHYANSRNHTSSNKVKEATR